MSHIIPFRVNKQLKKSKESNKSWRAELIQNILQRCKSN